MNAEKLKETRMKIAYNLMQGLVAYEGAYFDRTMKNNVEWAYQVADEVLKQGGYDEAKTKNEELRKLEQRVAESEFKARLARGNKDSLHAGIVGTKELDYSSLSQGEQQRIVEIRKTYGIRDEE